MKWIKDDITIERPIKSWCSNLDDGALDQAVNLANHPAITGHVALMPDCHVGYGMPIGGVIACEDAIIPNAVGVDIGCGMAAIQTNYNSKSLRGIKEIRKVLDYIKDRVPLGEGRSYNELQEWSGFGDYLKKLNITEEELDFNNSELNLPGWMDKKSWKLAQYNLGSLGGGNHFIEMQKDQDGMVWIMLHSGSRNLGYSIATHHLNIAKVLTSKKGIRLDDANLAFLDTNSDEGKAYIRDMNFAMRYAEENRKRMMDVFKESISKYLKRAEFVQEINIHHNYAAVETHNNKDVWIHRKGATSAKQGELGIIPGSMGTSSYIVEGLGNEESYTSCSHGAGRKMGRMEACKRLSVEKSDKAMNGIVFDRWSKLKKFGKKVRGKDMYDLGESPLAYKNIDQVIEAQLDLVKPLVKLQPLGVLKG